MHRACVLEQGVVRADQDKSRSSDVSKALLRETHLTGLQASFLSHLKACHTRSEPPSAAVTMARESALLAELSPAVLDMHRAIKNALDPAGILSPGKVTDDIVTSVRPPERTATTVSSRFCYDRCGALAPQYAVTGSSE